MTKKLQAFNTCQSRVKRTLGHLEEDQREFEALQDQATSQHKIKLENLLKTLIEQFRQMEDELIEVATELTEPQLKGCNDSVAQLDGSVRTLSKNVESQLRDFEAKERKVQEHEAKAAKAEADAAMAAAAAAQKNVRPRQEEDINTVFNKSLHNFICNNCVMSISSVKDAL